MDGPRETVFNVERSRFTSESSNKGNAQDFTPASMWLESCTARSVLYLRLWQEEYIIARTFEEMEVWKSPRELVRMIYRATQAPAIRRDVGLVNQIRWAAVSVMSNVAEGFERGTKAEFIHFLFVAKGSAGEVRSQLYVAIDQKYLKEEECQELFEQCRVVSSQLGKLILYLKRQQVKK